MEILKSGICLFNFYSFQLMTILQMYFALCSMNKISKNADDGRVLKNLNLVFKKGGKCFFGNVW